VFFAKEIRGAYVNDGTHGDVGAKPSYVSAAVLGCFLAIFGFLFGPLDQFFGISTFRQLLLGFCGLMGRNPDAGLHLFMLPFTLAVLLAASVGAIRARRMRSVGLIGILLLVTVGIHFAAFGTGFGLNWGWGLLAGGPLLMTIAGFISTGAEHTFPESRTELQ
jgi:hypothetical protein